jgi:hypothetical protein
MSEQTINNHIIEILAGDARENALEFTSYLRASEMQFERGKGYWKNQRYWMIKYKNEYVCFILINGSGAEEASGPLTIWSDDSGSNWFENYPLNEYMKEIAWKNVDICGKCGGCTVQGTHKTIFGKEFDNVCRTTFRFVNPDARTLACVKKLVELRKNDIEVTSDYMPKER